MVAPPGSFDRETTEWVLSSEDASTLGEGSVRSSPALTGQLGLAGSTGWPGSPVARYRRPGRQMHNRFYSSTHDGYLDLGAR